MNMKAMLGAVLSLVLAVGTTAFLATWRPTSPAPAPVPNATDPAAGTDPKPVDPDESWPTNEFDLKDPAPDSQVEVPERHHVFGVMALGSEQSFDFEFKNTGQGPLRLHKGPLQCKCTMPTVTKEDIPPGASVLIKLTWKPVEESESFKKQAIIWTNDPTNPKIELSIQGEVYKEVSVVPHELAFGAFSAKKEVESKVLIQSVVSEDLEIQEIKVSHPLWMQATSEKVAAEDLPEKTGHGRKPKSGVAVTLKLSPVKEFGAIFGWIKVKTNRSDEELTINVSGTRSGPISIQGTAFEVATSLLTLNRFTSAEGKNENLIMFLEPFGEDLKILEVVSASQNLKATLTKDVRKSSAGGSPKDRYVLKIQVVKGLTPGTAFQHSDPDPLTIKTNHPEVPELHFRACYIVQ